MLPGKSYTKEVGPVNRALLFENYLLTSNQAIESVCTG